MRLVGGIARLGMLLCGIAVFVSLFSGNWGAAGVSFLVGCLCTAVAMRLGTYS